MTRTSSNDLDYLATRLHARRGRMAEAGRLDELSRLRTLPELGRAIFPGAEFSGAMDFQRRLVLDLIRELSTGLKHLEGEAQELIASLLARFLWENVKVMLRGFLNHTPVEVLQPHLVASPALTLDATTLMAAKSLEDFVNRLPPGGPRNRLHLAVAAQREPPPPFILEAALDSGSFRDLIVRVSRLPGGEEEIVRPLIFQEANLFQFLLVARGKFHFGLAPDTLAPLRLERSGAPTGWFPALLAAPDILAMAKSSVGVVIDAMPAAGSAGGEAGIDIPALEALGWQRYLRLANSAFRRSHMGVGAVAGYFCVRRLEIANLISLSEGLRLGLADRDIRTRLLPRSEREVAHV